MGKREELFCVVDDGIQEVSHPEAAAAVHRLGPVEGPDGESEHICRICTHLREVFREEESYGRDHVGAVAGAVDSLG